METVRSSCNSTIGGQEMHDVEDVRFQIRAQQVKSGAREQRAAIAIVNVFADELPWSQTLALRGHSSGRSAAVIGGRRSAGGPWMVTGFR
jgi:hypothetical protein